MRKTLTAFYLLFLFPSYSLSTRTPPPIVYTIAGSDSGGGAGIQADLHAIQAFGCHGCSAITCLTAQNSVGVSQVHAPPATFLQKQLDTLFEDLPPAAIKIGMLGTEELAMLVGSFLQKVIRSSPRKKTWVVLDPVMISTSGHRLIEKDAQEAMVEHIFPYVDLITPNKFEAETLLGRKLSSPDDIEDGARELLNMGARAVLIKGGHVTAEETDFAEDFFLSSKSAGEEERLCDGHRGVWLRSPRYHTIHTHGTGCTLSSAIASALALGERERLQEDHRRGALSSIDLVDACCLAKAYVTAGIYHGIQLGQGPGPVAHTGFPVAFFPSIHSIHSKETPSFRRMAAFNTKHSTVDSLACLLPIVDSEEWVERLCSTSGISDIQLRVKGLTDKSMIVDMVKRCQQMCEAANVRLWVNDFWEAAIEANCYGVHVGQEDLLKCIKAGGLTKLLERDIALGISTHSYSELAAALGVKPSYVSLGPIFATQSKNVRFDPQGLDTVARWRKLIPADTPLVVIGGIGDAASVAAVREAGADCVAVIGAVTKARDTRVAVEQLSQAMVAGFQQ